ILSKKVHKHSLAGEGCHHTPERLNRGYEKTQHVCSSLAAFWESSSESPVQRKHKGWISEKIRGCTTSD
uniref:Uncharacterized protein n=1 Tax=Echeneis naucrates TaxID=173247 RepID=A0A665X528_ECHNA